MLHITSINRFLLVFVLLCCTLIPSKSQNTAKVKIINADKLSFKKSEQPDYQILEGNVVFEYESSRLYCQIAHIYLKRDYVATYNNVKIVTKDSTYIYGDTLLIDGDNKLVEISGKVILIDGQTQLKTNKLFYDLNNSIAYYTNYAEITTEDKYIKSKKGYYYNSQKEFVFTDSVYVRQNGLIINSDSIKYHTKTEIAHLFKNNKMYDDEQTFLFNRGVYDLKHDVGRFAGKISVVSSSRLLLGDSLFYSKPEQIAEVFKNVFFKDSVDNIILTSHYGKFFEADSSFFVTDSVLLRIIDNQDTTFLHSDTILLYNDSLKYKQKIILSYYNSRLYNYDFQAVCDSLVILKEDSIIFFHKSPILWLDSTQLIADTIYVTYKNGKADRIYLRENSFIASKEETNDFQQIKSNTIEGTFNDNKLDELLASSNAETIYYVFDDDFKLIGINIAKSDKLKIKFVDNKANTIVFLSKPEGVLYPEKDLTEEQKFLPGFRWENKKRPKHPLDVFTGKKPKSETQFENANEDIGNKSDDTEKKDTISGEVKTNGSGRKKEKETTENLSANLKKTSLFRKIINAPVKFIKKIVRFFNFRKK